MPVSVYLSCSLEQAIALSGRKERAINALPEAPILETERLRLRPLEGGDLEDYAEMYSDREVLRYLGGGPEPWDRSRSWRHLAFVRGHWQLLGTGVWAIEHRESGAFVGSVGFWEPEGWLGFELAWTLARRWWGFGFATEGARAALDYAFTIWKKDRVISLINPENHPSIRVAERIGESLVGRACHGGREMLVYGIDRATPILFFPRTQPAPSPGETTLRHAGSVGLAGSP